MGGFNLSQKVILTSIIIALIAGSISFLSFIEINDQAQDKIMPPQDVTVEEYSYDKVSLKWNNMNSRQKNIIVLFKDIQKDEIYNMRILSPNTNYIEMFVKPNIQTKVIVRAVTDEGINFDNDDLTFLMIRNEDEDHIFKLKDTEILLYKGSYIKDFDTFVYNGYDKETDQNYVKIDYIPYNPEENIIEKIIKEKNYSINNFMFPIGIKTLNKNINLNTPRYMNVESVSKVVDTVAFKKSTNYYPLIPTFLTDSDFEQIFPTIVNVYSPIFFNLPVYQSLEIKLYYNQQKEVPHFAELWKVKPEFDEIKFYEDLVFFNELIPIKAQSFRKTELQLNKEKKEFQKNKKALIFVHGLQIIDLKNKTEEGFPWRINSRFEYFNQWFRYIYENDEKFKDFDFYEFLYDTHTQTVEDFGKDLNEIMTKNDFFDEKNGYDEIYFISHSMGGLVSRFTVNQGDYDNIGNIVTINAVNRGSPLQNLPQLFSSQIVKNIVPNTNFMIPLLEIGKKLIVSFFNGENLTIDKEVEEILQSNPVFFPVVFSQLGMLDPFYGGTSINYDNEEYLASLEKTLYPQVTEGKIFKSNQLVKNLNKDDKYLDKTVIVYSTTNEKSGDIAYNFSYAVLKAFGDMTGSTDDDIENDGAVPLSSQIIEGVEGPKIDNTYSENTTHKGILSNEKVIEGVFKKYILMGGIQK
ncbi:MAG: hypothetical protein PWP28_2202 [Oceanotoga sp.]|jgi:hypothetical protein|nr:hypothetical protein [Oceanotoga sp.]